MAQAINSGNFEALVATGKPLVLDFWATWCGPCRMVAPFVEQLASEYKEKAVVVKCNVDEAQQIPMQYGIRNIPTLLFFKNGEVVDKLVGANPKNVIEEKLKALL